jgi:hypothetical protein
VTSIASADGRISDVRSSSGRGEIFPKISGRISFSSALHARSRRHDRCRSICHDMGSPAGVKHHHSLPALRAARCAGMAGAIGCRGMVHLSILRPRLVGAPAQRPPGAGQPDRDFCASAYTGVIFVLACPERAERVEGSLVLGAWSVPLSLQSHDQDQRCKCRRGDECPSHRPEVGGRRRSHREPDGAEHSRCRRSHRRPRCQVASRRPRDRCE